MFLDLAICHSKFLNAALGSAFVEGRSEVVNLPEHDPLPFQIFAQWIYEGKINTKHLLFGERTKLDEGYWGTALVKAYALGDFLQNHEFQNDVLDKFYECCRNENELPADPEIPLVYNETREDSPLRRLVVDLYIDGKRKFSQLDLIRL